MKSDRVVNTKDVLPTEGGGWFYGELPKGCELCLQGKKLVYFMGGDCPIHPNAVGTVPYQQNGDRKMRILQMNYQSKMP